MELGVVGRLGESLRDRDVEAIQLAHVNSVKIDTLGNHEEFSVIMQPPSGDGYASAVDEAYSRGIRRFMIHRQPNIDDGGMNYYWRDGEEFAKWWIDVRSKLDEFFPDAFWGFPSLKQGENNTWIADAEQFFVEAYEAVDEADFIELQAQWKNERERKIQLWRIDSYLHRHPGNKWTVEFCNVNSNVSKEDKAYEYLEFYQALDKRDEIETAFVSCVSSPDPMVSRYACWCGESGAFSDIPGIIGDRDW